MSVGEDPIEDLRPIAMQLGMVTTRAAESGIRAAQDKKQRRGVETQGATEDLARRHEAQAVMAQQHFARIRSDERWVETAPSREVAGTWRAAQEWSQQDRERFGEHADHINAAVGRHAHMDLAAIAAKNPDLDAVETLARQGVDVARQVGERNVESVEKGEAERLRDQERQKVTETIEESDPERAEQSREDALEIGDQAAYAENAEERAGLSADDLEYDSSARREATAREMSRAGVPAQQAHAHQLADRINSTDPSKAGKGVKKAKRSRPVAARGNDRNRGISR